MYCSYDNYNDYEDWYYRDEEEDDVMEDVVDDLVEEYLIESRY